MSRNGVAIIRAGMAISCCCRRSLRNRILGIMMVLVTSSVYNMYKLVIFKYVIQYNHIHY